MGVSIEGTATREVAIDFPLHAGWLAVDGGRNSIWPEQGPSTVVREIGTSKPH